MSALRREYFPSPTIAQMFDDEHRIRYVQGPIGSGKTTGAIVELFRRAHMMPVGPDGIKRFRAVLVRNTRQQLRDTTQKSFFAMFPPGVAGHYRATDATFVIKTGQVEFEFLFRALDTPDDVRQLLSLELTAGFLEEAREIDEEIFSALNSRLGRYPSPAQGGCPKPFMLMVSNPPVVGSWLWELVEQKKPRNFRAFFQPPALIPGTKEVNPEAENLENLDTAPRQLGDYYRDAMDTATEEFINVYLRNQYGSVTGGQAVYREEYDASVHLAPHALEATPNRSIILGVDPGLTPAVAIGQLDTFGQLRVLDEVCGKSVGAYRFIREQLKPMLAEKYPHNAPVVVIDPAARNRSQTDERTVMDVFKAAGFRVLLASTNNPIARVDCVKRFLTRRIEVSRGESKPGLLVSPTCHTLRSALSGGYYYAVSQKGVMAPSPVKNGYSHISDGLQYLCLHAEAKMGFEDAAPVRLAPRLANDNWRGFTL